MNWRCRRLVENTTTVIRKGMKQTIVPTKSRMVNLEMSNLENLKENVTDVERTDTNIPTSGKTRRMRISVRSSEQAAVATDSSGSINKGGAELFLMGMNKMGFQNTQNILEDPNVLSGTLEQPAIQHFRSWDLKKIKSPLPDV